MDTLTEKEFMRVFVRVSKHVDFQGAFSADAILAKMQASKAWKKAPRKYSRWQKKWVSVKGSIRRLAEKGFHRRVISELRRAKSDNLIYLTLVWGREKAEEIKKTLARRRLPRRRPGYRRPVSREERTRERERIERVMVGLRRREAVRKKKRWWMA